MQYELGETKIIIDETFCQAQEQEAVNQAIAKNVYERVLRWIWAQEQNNIQSTQDHKE